MGSTICLVLLISDRGVELHLGSFTIEFVAPKIIFLLEEWITCSSTLPSTTSLFLLIRGMHEHARSTKSLVAPT